MTVLFLTLALLLAYLVIERALVSNHRRSIPMVIAVTGTRGKSGVVRMLAYVLRESGRTVFAKTTGSQAQMVLPDGSVHAVPRRGMVSILEQKMILRRAARDRAGCLVVEIMSIHPENHIVEAQRILRPDIVVLTNVRRDHIEAMGETEGEIAAVLRNDIPAGASFYVPERYARYFDALPAEVPSIHLKTVRKGSAASLIPMLGSARRLEFSENLDLVAEVSRDLGIDDECIGRGISKAIHDIGRLGIWTFKTEDKTLFLVNAFAANDPDSTAEVLEKAREILGKRSQPFTGLLNLRRDRPDRTLQWITALNNGMSARFKRIHVMGGHTHVFIRRVESSRILAVSSPAAMMRAVASGMENGEVVFGFGNIGGEGEKLVEFWSQQGVKYGV